MIRLIQRRLIIPRGDTGTLSIPVLAGKNVGDVPIFTIFNTLTHRKVFEKTMEMADSTLTIEFKHGDTVNLPVGQYVWDIKFYTNPVFADEKLISGTEVDSYYAAFNLPICEIRETGDNLLMADDAPTSTLRPDQINLIEAAITDINASKSAAALSETNAATSASNASTSELNAEQYAAGALLSKNRAIEAESNASASATAAAASAQQAAATAQAIHEEIPTKVSDLLDDSGHYTKPANGIPAADLEETYVKFNDYASSSKAGVIRILGNGPFIQTELNGGITFFGINPPTLNDLKTASAQQKIVNVASEDIATFYGLALAAGDRTQSHSDNTVGTYTTEAKTAIQTMLGVPSTSAIPTNVSQLTNDAGYLTEHQDISGKANSADLATVATSGSYNDLLNKPTIPDIQIDSTSIVENGVANIPVASSNVPGVVGVNSQQGITLGSGNNLEIHPASNAEIKSGNQYLKAIVPSRQENAVFYGLAKAAGADESTSQEAMGTYREPAKTAIRNMIGAAAITDIPTKVSDLQDDSGHYTKPANGIPASDLEETYLTQHQDISGKANSADLATVATSGSYEDLSNKPTIPDIQVAGTSIVENGVANIPEGGEGQYGVYQLGSFDYGLGITTLGTGDKILTIATAPSILIKYGTSNRPINPAKQHESVFYGLAKAAGDTTQSQSNNAVGTYTDSAKTAIQNMLGVPAASAIPTLVSQLTNDSGYLTSFTETDPTVPSWAKAQNKPTYTASEVGAPTVQEMNTAIGTAIGNINSFDMAVVQELPTEDISTHTIYLVPKTGETNDVYDEYVYINNAWEMVGNTQIDLSNYVQFTDYANSNTAGVVKIGAENLGLAISNDGTLGILTAPSNIIKAGSTSLRPIPPQRQHESVFYGLAKAAGDTTQSQSANAVGTYTDEAKSAIRSMLGAATSSDIPNVPVQDVQINGNSILNNNIANIPYAATNIPGVVKIWASNGITISSGGGAGELAINKATTSEIRDGVNNYKPIVPSTQSNAVFYGLAKVSGDVSQPLSGNTVGTYTDAAKGAIQNMLGISDLLSTREVSTATAAHAINTLFLMDGKLYKATSAIAIGDAVVEGTNCQVVKADEVFVKNTDYATSSTAGIVSPGNGLYMSTVDPTKILLNIAFVANTKEGTSAIAALTPSVQHAAAFYGLAKAAGDTTQAASSNAVGTYTSSAATSIKTMLQVQEGLEVVRLI